MLVIEGPDLVGKTMLASRMVGILQERHRMPMVYRHMTRLPDCWRYHRDYLPHICRKAVMDRFHVSELAYGKVTRGHTKIMPRDLRFLEAALCLNGTVTVLIVADEAFLRQQWAAKQRNEMFELDTVLRVNDEFQSMIGKVGGPHFDFVHTVKDIDTFVSLEQAEAWAAKYAEVVIDVKAREEWMR